MPTPGPFYRDPSEETPEEGPILCRMRRRTHEHLAPRYLAAELGRGEDVVVSRDGGGDPDDGDAFTRAAWMTMTEEGDGNRSWRGADVGGDDPARERSSC
jgi:hypothetical protein